MNSPEKILTKLIHRRNYFNNVGKTEMELFKSKIMVHVATCKHSYCKNLRDNFVI